MIHPIPDRIIPTGVCFCGCGADAPVGSFFLAGHNKRAVVHVIRKHYDSEVRFLAAHGYPNGIREAS